MSQSAPNSNNYLYFITFLIISLQFFSPVTLDPIPKSSGVSGRSVDRGRRAVVEGSSSGSSSHSNKSTNLTDLNNDASLANASSSVLNRLHVEKTCHPEKSPKCWGSDRAIPICASNGLVYKNPGVLMCAQACNNCNIESVFLKVTLRMK
jgi:hypothetical protein